jgi:hypothetical protein
MSQLFQSKWAEPIKEISSDLFGDSELLHVLHALHVLHV